ncbi:MAG: STAS domain-containing protein [Spirochaetes bacterium]|nr:STAS domain-containing protein [Spirochaetota bacterium]
MHITYRDLRDHRIVMLKGDMDYMSIREVKDTILRMIGEGAKSIILDLAQVDFMDSAGMGMLVSVNKEMIRNGGTTGLINVSEEIFNLLKLATVDTIIRIYNNEDEIK